eukprot:8893312-Karenia_brevis.AAC.1
MLVYGLTNRLPHTSLYVDLPSHIVTLLDSAVLHTLHHLTSSQIQQLEHGSLHLSTRKITGHFSPRSAPQVDLMSESMRAYMTGLSSVPQFPRTQPHPVPFACPQ